jgi:putative acyl-CoA dehydrogenase
VESPFPNQPPPYEGRNLYVADRALREAVAREGAAHADAALAQWGDRLGRTETFALADEANRHPPTLRTLDRTGERVDEVVFHPAWHALMSMATQVGEHASPWREPRAGAHVARGAMYVLHAQVENGTQCPLTMTFAGVAALREHAIPAIRDAWLPKLLAYDYDPRPGLPVDRKRAALLGMGMTERQGGSDVRSNRTSAVAQADGSWRLTGHKWFFSAPQCDAHLVLARCGDEGIGCFLVPRRLPDGSRNRLALVRLKDKVGNRSNASSEVEFHDALGHLVGEPGRGIATILEMVRHTRLDCVLGSAGLVRGALGWALHHASHRVAFGRRLVEQPLMANVLADLALESEAAIALALRLARAFDAHADPAEAALARVVTPAAKYWVCKRGAAFVAEAMEVLGGNGYIEENPLPRFYREAPVNSIWEGSGNVIALDVLRALSRDGAADALIAELETARGGHADYDAAFDALRDDLQQVVQEPSSARRATQAIALLLQASLLLRHAPAAVAGAFCASRLRGDRFAGAAFGTLPRDADFAAIVSRASCG